MTKNKLTSFIKEMFPHKYSFQFSSFAYVMQIIQYTEDAQIKPKILQQLPNIFLQITKKK